MEGEGREKEEGREGEGRRARRRGVRREGRRKIEVWRGKGEVGPEKKEGWGG